MDQSSNSTFATLIALSVICSRSGGDKLQKKDMVDNLLSGSSFALAATIGMSTALAKRSHQETKFDDQESSADDMPSLSPDCNRIDQPTTEADDSSTSSSNEVDDDVSFYICEEEGFCSSQSVCDSDISVSDLSDFDDDFDDDDDDESYCSQDEAVLKKQNPLHILYQDFKVQVDDTLVPEMKPCDSDYTLTTISPSRADMFGRSFVVSNKVKDGISTQRNATWAIFD